MMTNVRGYIIYFNININTTIFMTMMMTRKAEVAKRNETKPNREEK